LLEHAPYEYPTASNTFLVGGPRGVNVNSSTGEALPYRGLRSEQFLYVEYPIGEVELYDLEKDPYQLENIASSANPKLVEMLSTRLEELAKCSGSTCREVEDREI
jgi:hypothetical protein